MKKAKMLVQCVVNGEEVAEYVDPRESLLDMLRNHLGLTSVKRGCEVGECGACTVIIDGETIDSCIYLAVWAEGKNIRTLEGLEKNGELTRIQEAFIEEGAGFYHVGNGSSGAGKRTDQRRNQEKNVRKSLPLYGISEYRQCGRKSDA